MEPTGVRVGPPGVSPEGKGETLLAVSQFVLLFQVRKSVLRNKIYFVTFNCDFHIKIDCYDTKYAEK